MRLSNLIFILSAFFTGLSSCAPHGSDWDWDGNDARDHRRGCLTDHDAELIVTQYESLFVKTDVALANKLLADDFQEISDSINFFLSELPGTITAPTKAIFIAMEVNLTATPQPGITTEAIYHNCHTITFRWYLNYTPYVSRGIDVLIIKPDTYQIEKDYSEYNNAAFLVDIGLFPCKSS